jgi:deazaflavin-dependent oxidoreductase (nitroreductase family)
MPIPDAVARFNRIATNRVTGPFAGRLPGFAVVHHKGRRSGRAYETPVGVVRRHDGYAIALTYGPDRDWVKNVMAAGGCELELRGKMVQVGRPEIVHDPDRGDMPPSVRQILRLIGVADFLHMTKI